MSPIDVNEQWRALQENYASMADEELEAIAQDASDLTDLARQVLQAEISRRKLQIQLQLNSAGEGETSTHEEELPSGYPEGFNPEDWGLVSFSHVDNIEEAQQLKARFDDAGVPAYFGPDVVDDLRLIPPEFTGSLEVKVREVDHARALAVMSRYAPEPAEAQADEPCAYSCPQCHSEEIIFRKLEKSKLQSGEEPKFSWKCEACGYRWKDDGIEAQA